MFSHRECSLTNSPVRRGIRQTCYLFGGYGTSVEDNGTAHLLVSSYRCHLKVNESTSLYSIELEDMTGDGMRYPRMHHQIAALGSLIYIVGGEDGDSIFNSVEIFDPLTKLPDQQWLQAGSMITPRCNFGLVAFDSSTLYALGGHIGADITSTIEKFDCQTGLWTLLPYRLKSPCYGFACVQLNGVIFCIGGSCLFNLPLKSTEIFTPRTGQSYFCSDMHEARSFPSACVDPDQEKIYVFGGADANGNGLRTVEVYDSYHCRWSYLPSMLFNRISPCAFRLGYFLFVFGGRTSLASNAEILNTAEIFDLEKNTWIRTDDLSVRFYGATSILR
jgi:Kelch motif